MEGISFKAAYGDRDINVELSRLIGGYWHILIGSRYYGQVHNRSGKWTVLPQNEGTFTLDDMEEISERITRYEQNRNQG